VLGEVSRIFKNTELSGFAKFKILFLFLSLILMKIKFCRFLKRSEDIERFGKRVALNIALSNQISQIIPYFKKLSREWKKRKIALAFMVKIC